MRRTMRAKGNAPGTARRGSVYVLVLSASFVVTMIGLTALTISRLRLARGGETNDWAVAQSLARSGVEHALQHMSGSVATLGDDAWRNAYVVNASSAEFALGSGTFSWTLVDEIDGNLIDDSTEPVAILAVGRCGEAVHRLRVELETLPCEEGLACLETAVHVGDRLEFKDTIVRGNGILSSNNEVDANNAEVFADVEAVEEIDGDTYHGSTTTGIDPREMPDSSVFDLYAGLGTEIDMVSIAGVGSDWVLSDVLLSPSSNPFGQPDPLGIYVIDCAGSNITIRYSRIVGTLVILNPKSGSKIEGSITWEPAIGNYPALLADGEIEFGFEDDALAESPGHNFNPPGTPWRGGADSDVSDQYPSVIAGLVYVSVSADMNAGSMVFEGPLLVADRLKVDDAEALTLVYRDTWLMNPPPGYQLSGGAPRVVAGSFVEVVP